MVVAGPGLRTTVVDVVLRNLVRNATLADGRRRTAIPLFTGRRLPQSIGAPASIALDITALLVLGWLGLLPKVLEAFSKVILPAGALIELFEGRKRIRQAQRTRLHKAVEVRDAIANGRITVPAAATAVGPIPLPAYLAHKLQEKAWPELAALEARANASQLPPC